MEEQKSYTINVKGKKPGIIGVGTVNKTTGLPDPGMQQVVMEVGEINIPNYSHAWGELVKEPKTGKLTGEVKFYPWESEKGTIIEIRYLSNCPSISVEYQTERGFYAKKDGAIVIKKEDAEIRLKIGLNKFKQPIDKNLILMLQHHSLNSSNTSRNPDHRYTRFSNHSTEGFVSTSAKEVQDRHKAEQIVLDAQHKSSNLKVLAILFDMDLEEADEAKTFNTLLSYASNPKFFLEVLSKKAADYKDLLTKATSIELIDLQDVMKEGNVTIMEGGIRNILLTGVEGSGIDERIEFITDNITKAEYYHALNRLAESYELFKKTVLT